MLQKPYCLILAPPVLWSGPRPTRPAARSRPPRDETPPLPATSCRPGSLLRSQPDQPSHGRGNASSRPFRLRSLGRARDISDLVSRVSAGVVPCVAGHAVPPCHHGSQTLSGDRRIALAAAGRRPVMVALCKSKLSGCRGGSVRNPGEPSTVSMLRQSPCSSSRQHTSHCHENQPSRHMRQGQGKLCLVRVRIGARGQRKHRIPPHPCRLFTQFPSRPPHYSFCLSCMTCWSQLSSRPQRLSPIFFP